MARRRKVSFKATKIVKSPTKVKFKTKEGKNVSFKATKLQRKRVEVSFYAKRKKKRK